MLSGRLIQLAQFDFFVIVILFRFFVNVDIHTEYTLSEETKFKKNIYW